MSQAPSPPNGRRVIHLDGSVDLEHTPDIRDVLVDLSAVTYIDSSGIACLIEALHEAREQGADLGLVSVSIQAMRVLKLARLDMVFPIHADLASATQALARASRA
ncbi:MAG: STAS domain-containing protein [Kiloniellaceae bacterium]